MSLDQKVLNKLSLESKKEVEDFIQFLIQKEEKKFKTNERPFGLCNGEIIISDDFIDPLDDNTLKEWGLT